MKKYKHRRKFQQDGPLMSQPDYGSKGMGSFSEQVNKKTTVALIAADLFERAQDESSI